jgi:hypothetical protein
LKRHRGATGRPRGARVDNFAPSLGGSLYCASPDSDAQLRPFSTVASNPKRPGHLLPHLQPGRRFLQHAIPFVGRHLLQDSDDLVNGGGELGG